MAKQHLLVVSTLISLLGAGAVIAKDRRIEVVPMSSAISAAKEAGMHVDAWAGKVDQVLGRLQDQMRESAPGDLEAEGRTVNGFRELIPLLKTRATVLLDGYGSFNDAYGSYKKALIAAPEAFENLAAAYQRHAQEEPDPYFREQYLALASQAKQVGTGLKNRVSRLDREHANVGVKRQYLEKSVIFL